MSKTCSRCHGEAGYWTKIMNHRSRELREAYVVCDMPGCHNGIVDPIENYLALCSGVTWLPKNYFNLSLQLS